MTSIEQEFIRNKKYTTAGGTTAYTLTMPNTPALYDGLQVTVKMNATNTWASTININSIGAKTIKTSDGNDVASGALVSDGVYTLVYDLAQDFFFVPRVISGWWNNNYVLGGLWNYIGSYGINTWSQVFSDPRSRVIDFWSYLYLFCLISRTPTGASNRGTAAIVWKMDKTTWVITYIWQEDANTAGGGSVPIVASSYVDWTDIYINVVGWSWSWYFKVDTLTDTLTVVTWATYTTGTLTNTVSVIVSGIAYDAISIISNRIAPPWTTSSDGWFVWLVEIHPVPYEANWIGEEIDSGSENIIQAIFFKDDWTELYIRDWFNARYEQRNLSTPWDLSTHTSVGILSTESGSTWLFIWNSWQYLYSVVWSTTDRVYRRTMSTPWLLSTWASAQNYNPTAETNDVRGVWLKSDWTKMYLLGADNNTVFQYSLSTPWQINSGVTYDSISLVFEFDPMFRNDVTQFSMSPNWDELFAIWTTTRKIYKYSLSTAWDLSTAVYTGSYVNTYLYNPLDAPTAIAFKTDMSIMYVANWVDTSSFSRNNVEEYDIV